MKFHLSVKKSIIILVIIAVIGVIGVIATTGKKNAGIYTTAPVTRSQIIQTVSETGTVKAVHEIDLSFLNTGKIAKIYAAVGDQVKQGDLLAELDYGGLNYSKNEAQANLDVAQSNLNKLLAGATREEIAVAQANVNQARAAYEAAQSELTRTQETAAETVMQAQKNLNDLESKTENDVTTYESAVTSARTKLDTTKSTYQKAIDNDKTTAINTVEDKLAVANKSLDTVDRTLKDEDGEDYISLKDMTYLHKTNLDYLDSDSALAEAKITLANAKSDNHNDNTIKALDDTLSTLNLVFTTLQNCYSALENSVISSAFTQAKLDTLKANISSEQTAISAAISAVQTAKHNLNDAILAYDTNVLTAQDGLTQAQAAYDNALLVAKNALSTAQLNGDQQITLAQSKVSTTQEAWQVAQAQLKKIMAAADQNDMSLAKAKVRQAQAALDSVTEQIDNSMIKAESDGTITKKNYVAGEQVLAGSPVFSMLGENNYEIELLVSEADIAKVKTGDTAEITLDAFGDDVKFAGEVSFIEPAETVIQDVIYYKVKINFQPEQADLKSGMTANVTITTAQKDNVLVVPSRAIIEKNGAGKFVQILENNQPVDKSVTLGLRGDEGMTEIVSGLNEGEQVITYTKQ